MFSTGRAERSSCSESKGEAHSLQSGFAIFLQDTKRIGNFAITFLINFRESRRGSLTQDRISYHTNIGRDQMHVWKGTGPEGACTQL